MKRHYWLIMRYACNRCSHRVDFYLEDGCEGPRDRQVAPPSAWKRMREMSPVRAQLPATVPQTASGRFVLPVPFVAERPSRQQTLVDFTIRVIGQGLLHAVSR